MMSTRESRLSNAVKVDIQPSSPAAPLGVSAVDRANVSPYVIDKRSQELEQIVSRLPPNHWFLFLGYMSEQGTHHDNAQFGCTGKPYIGEPTLVGAKAELNEETGHKLKRGESLAFQGQGIFRRARLTYYSVNVQQLCRGTFYSDTPGRHASVQQQPDTDEDKPKDDFKRRIMIIIHGTKSEMERFARNAAGELRRPDLNPDNIGYYYIMSRDATLKAISQQPTGEWGGWVSV